MKCWVPHDSINMRTAHQTIKNEGFFSCGPKGLIFFQLFQSVDCSSPAIPGSMAPLDLDRQVSAGDEKAASGPRNPMSSFLVRGGRFFFFHGQTKKAVVSCENVIKCADFGETIHSVCLGIHAEPLWRTVC